MWRRSRSSAPPSGGFFVGPTLFDRVGTGMDIYTDAIFGPVLVGLRADSLAAAIDLVNANPYGNGTAIFTSSGHAARTFQRQVHVGMIGINPPGSTARVHQHLDVGQGEVDWDEFFATLARIGFDGIATVCVFAWEERARESSRSNRGKVAEYLAKHFCGRSSG